MRIPIQVLTLATLVLLVAVGCDESNPLGAFQPEIVNNPDAFEFQITDANDVSTTLTYSWSNSGTRATIDHSTATSDGAASVVLLDADGKQVYSAELKASGTEESAVGTAGVWSIEIVFVRFDGTSNFRVQKL